MRFIVDSYGIEKVKNLEKHKVRSHNKVRLKCAHFSSRMKYVSCGTTIWNVLFDLAWTVMKCCRHLAKAIE